MNNQNQSLNPNQYLPSENTYVDELKKCIGKVVQVVREDGQTFKGVCKAISFTHLNIVLMTETHKIIIKNISHIVRERDSATNYYPQNRNPLPPQPLRFQAQQQAQQSQQTQQPSQISQPLQTSPPLPEQPFVANISNVISDALSTTSISIPQPMTTEEILNENYQFFPTPKAKMGRGRPRKNI